jgi:hypothetical protein
VNERRQYILSPAVDLLLVGGLSIAFFVPLLLSGRTDLLLVGAGFQAWAGTLLNMPHFMASYRIIYRDKAMIMRHKWAAIWIPLILAIYIVLALMEARESPVLILVLVTVSSSYLAWHYTGQVWGMMASYMWLEGQKFEKSEKFLIRTSLRILLAWHVCWFLLTDLRDPSRILGLYRILSIGTLVAFVLGTIGIARMRARTGKLPPPRALVAWFAIFVWYAVIGRDPKAIFWIQIAHAIQYLAFPVRVEMNRKVKGLSSPALTFTMHMALYGVLLLAISALLTTVVPYQAMSTIGKAFGEAPGKAAPILILMFINIHHYFTDGVIWKISNPEVREELFAHVARPRT